MEQTTPFPAVPQDDNPTLAVVCNVIKEVAWPHLNDSIRSQVAKYMHLAKITEKTRHISVHTLNGYAIQKGAAEPGICVILQVIWGSDVCKTREWWEEYATHPFVKHLPVGRMSNIGCLPPGKPRRRARAADRAVNNNNNNNSSNSKEEEAPLRRSIRTHGSPSPDASQEKRGYIRLHVTNREDRILIDTSEEEVDESMDEHVSEEQSEDGDPASSAASAGGDDEEIQQRQEIGMIASKTTQELRDDQVVLKVLQAKLSFIEREKKAMPLRGQEYMLHLESVSEGAEHGPTNAPGSSRNTGMAREDFPTQLERKIRELDEEAESIKRFIAKMENKQ